MTGQALHMSHPAQGGLALLQAPSLTLEHIGDSLWQQQESFMCSIDLPWPRAFCRLQALAHLSAWLPMLLTPDWPALASWQEALCNAWGRLALWEASCCNALVGASAGRRLAAMHWWASVLAGGLLQLIDWSCSAQQPWPWVAYIAHRLPTAGCMVGCCLQGWTQGCFRGQWGMRGSRRWLPGAASSLRTLTRGLCGSPAMRCRHSR